MIITNAQFLLMVLFCTATSRACKHASSAPQDCALLDIEARGFTMHTRPHSPRVSVIIPTKDEAKNLEVLLPDMPDVHEVVLVDAGSQDGTVDVARSHLSNLQVINQTRTGKGNALVCGMHAATGDILVTLDADGSADPCEIPAFVDALVEGADFAKGSRYMTGGGSVDLTRLRSAGNWGLNVLSNLSLGTKFTDLCYGYNAFWKSIVPALNLPDPDLPRPANGGRIWGDGFEIETLITVRAAQAGQLRTEPHPRREQSAHLRRRAAGAAHHRHRDGPQRPRQAHPAGCRPGTPPPAHLPPALTRVGTPACLRTHLNHRRTTTPTTRKASPLLSAPTRWTDGRTCTTACWRPPVNSRPPAALDACSWSSTTTTNS